MRIDELCGNDVPELVRLSGRPGFPFPMNEETALLYCAGKEGGPVGNHTYGVFEDDGTLASVMTVTYFRVFPCDDSPSGMIGHISGAYTHPDHRHKGFASMILDRIEADAVRLKADYLCMDSIADDLYLKHGYVKTVKESRLWKII
ncbi:MAG: GNAT family N-acetyltransferase [Lachnospiraceae bacterium]|nr:GNAT family N-acetyltransferase [Lachnospiraceae bacterium]